MAKRPKGNYKADNVNLRPPQLQFFKDELTITVTDTIIIKGNESNKYIKEVYKRRILNSFLTRISAYIILIILP